VFQLPAWLWAHRNSASYWTIPWTIRTPQRPWLYVLGPDWVTSKRSESSVSKNQTDGLLLIYLVNLRETVMVCMLDLGLFLSLKKILIPYQSSCVCICPPSDYLGQSHERQRYSCPRFACARSYWVQSFHSFSVITSHYKQGSNLRRGPLHLWVSVVQTIRGHSMKLASPGESYVLNETYDHRRYIQSLR